MDDERFDASTGFHRFFYIRTLIDVTFTVSQLEVRMRKIQACDNCGKDTRNVRFCCRSCATEVTNKESHRRLLKRDWSQIQQDHDGGMNLGELCKKWSMSYGAIYSALKSGAFVKRKQVHLHSAASKRLLSEKRKLWLHLHPELHPWRRGDKFKSVPCDALKRLLCDEGISFVEEYQPIDGRYYSIDISFPDKKIGIEVNGQQHYESNGRLKTYYQNRHDEIEAKGWRIIEIHYSVVFNKEIMDHLVNDLKSIHCLGISDYSFYKNRQEEIRKAKDKKRGESRQERLRRQLEESPWSCSMCGSKLHSETKTGLCVKCCGMIRRRVARPNAEVLICEVKEMGFCAVGRKYGVSDNAIRKWLSKV